MLKYSGRSWGRDAGRFLEKVGERMSAAPGRGDLWSSWGRSPQSFGRSCQMNRAELRPNLRASVLHS